MMYDILYGAESGEIPVSSVLLVAQMVSIIKQSEHSDSKDVKLYSSCRLESITFDTG